MSVSPLKRTVSGILLLDKPIGISSNAALQKVKYLYSARKAGHTGSLDLLATGMLPICFGEATKISQFLLDADKRYFVVAKLGEITSTGDAEGEIISKNSVPDLTNQLLEDVLNKFRGTLQQVPSMFSALKYQGKPLYELARQGITIERTARTIQITEIVFLNKTETTLTLEVACSKGTYIRTLIEDIGQALGCGAHVIELRRLSVAGYNNQSMLSLEQLEAIKKQDGDSFAVLDELLLPISSALQHMPMLIVSEATAYYLKRGQAIVVPKAPSEKGMIALFQHDQNHFFGMGEILEDGRLAPRRLINIS